ncbi:hypothetical protein D3C73_1640180 [compost metagenome]
MVAIPVRIGRARPTGNPFIQILLPGVGEQDTDVVHPRQLIDRMGFQFQLHRQ